MSFLAEKACLGDYGFTFLSDRYIDFTQVKKQSETNSLEECLSECLNENKFHCRGLTYNRTSKGRDEPDRLGLGCKFYRVVRI
jgi:hypothetical protein